MTKKSGIAKISWRFFGSMAKICHITGKKPSTGHNVSHSVRRTNRRFIPNLQWKRIFDPVTKVWVRIRVATSTLRTLSKPLSAHEAKKAARKAEKNAARKKVKA